MFADIKRMSFKHKNNKIVYYARNYFRQIIPASVFQKRLKSILNTENNFDVNYINSRVNYYNQLENILSPSPEAIKISGLGLKKKSTYYFDTYEYLRYFSPDLKVDCLWGDNTIIPDYPALTKSRPISKHNQNDVLLKLDKIRHFTFVNDTKPFSEKKNRLVGRAKAHQPHRQRFLEMYINHPMCNIGQVNRNMNPQFIRERLTITEHLDYKFILCLEGNDVASNLKWVMSSNSLAVMPLPVYETWFMEATLIPNHHFVLIKDDYSDLEERLNYYIDNPLEAQQIIENAHAYINQFKDKKQEDLISLLVLQKYFEKTGQL